MTRAHAHGPVGAGDARRLARGLALVAALMAGEVAAGLLAHSLALLSDAAHLLADAGALALSLAVVRLVRRPASGNMTFGLKRLEALAAQANGATLLVLAGLIVYGGIERLLAPPRPGGLAMLLVAVAGAAVSLLAARELGLADRRSLNVAGAFRHLLTDLFAFAATAAAGAVVLATGFGRADGIAALAIALVTATAGVGLLRDSSRVLLEIAPEHLSVEQVGLAMARHPQVADVHDLHVWELGAGFPALSAHVLVEPEADCHAVRRELETMLRERFALDHTTLQVDHAHAGLLQIGGTRAPRH